MPENLTRIHDKINYESNVVDPKTYAILLKAVKDNQPLEYERGRDEVFPNARSAAGMRWNPELRDTHASGTLEQYGLVIPDENRTITVSDLGYKFLECFDSDFNVLNEAKFHSVLIDMLMAWEDTGYGRYIHPGRILLKMMLDPDFGGYITNLEFLLWASSSNATRDDKYNLLKEEVLRYRENPYHMDPAKSDVFLRQFANSWGLFGKRIDDDVYTLWIRDDIKPWIERQFVYIETLPQSNGNPQHNNSQTNTQPITTIYYGIPGCGKSYYVENEILNDADKDTEVFRTTFYLDYTNSDFIGQIYPSVNDDGTVNYRYMPGPFTNALAKALKTPDRMIYLVVEEINRGDAAAIFGDIFQLLDRLEVNNSDGRVIGDSMYPINNEFIDKYFAQYNRDNPSEQIPHVPGSKIYIPHNLSLIATMNTTDQNINPLDTAFIRRWEKEYVLSKWEEVDKLYIPFTSIKWSDFAKAINKLITKDDSNGDAVPEDKQMGAFFATKKSLCIEGEPKEDKGKLKSFVNNIIYYLFKDVTKTNHLKLFKEESNYEDLYKKIYCDNPTDEWIKDIFISDVVQELYPTPTNENQTDN